MGFEIPLPPSATTPFEANNEKSFTARASVAVEFAATRPVPSAWFGDGLLLGRTLPGEDAVVNAIARLELGGKASFEILGETVTFDNVTLVNDVLTRGIVTGDVGTGVDLNEDLLGVPVFSFTHVGDWDVVIKGLIVIMYRHERKLRREVYNHILDNLLTVRGKRDPLADWFMLGEILGREIQIRETENHVLMIETSRYLTNQLLSLRLWREGKQADETFDNSANGVTAWMLAHLKVFLQHDFWEYNSLPYQRYSMAALQNLYDFAWDDEVKLAARAVLDYVSAKMAVSSNRLRRSVPFRRLAKERDKTALFGRPVDAQTSRFLMLSGLTTGLAEVGGKAHDESGDQLLRAALCTYRVPELILDVVMDKRHNSYYQQFHHGDHDDIPGGIEIYASEAAYLISAGGVWLPSGNGDLDEYDGYKNCGEAVPTTLMPTTAGVDRDDFIRIEGGHSFRNRVNNGVLRNFACGLDVVIPPRFNGSMERWGDWTFIDASDSSSEPANRFGFYAAVYSKDLSVLLEPFLLLLASNFGFFEVVPSAGLGFADFLKGVERRNRGAVFSATGDNEYKTHDGRTIRFTPHQADKYIWAISAINDTTMVNDIHSWPLARGDIINSDGHSGYVTVDNPFLRQKLVLDMRDPVIPRHYQYRLDAPRHTAGALVSRDLYRLDAFWVGPDGAVTATRWDQYVNDGFWAFPLLLTSPGGARPTSPVVSVARTSESLDVFWLGPDARLRTTWRAANTNGGEWHLPITVPNIKDQDVAADISQLAAVSRAPDHLDVLWVGRDGALRHHWWDAAATNGAWDSDHWAFPITQPGSARTHSPLSIIARTPAHLQVFFIAPDGSVWTHWWAEEVPGFGGAGPVPGGWRIPGPEMIAGPGSARPWSALTAVATSPMRVEVFWVGPDAAVWSHWWEEGGGSGSWSARPPVRVSPEGSVSSRSGLACVERFPGQVELFWITTTGAVAYLYRSDSVPGQGWTGPFDVTPPGVAHTYSPMHAVAREREHLDLTWVGPDGSLRTHWWDQRSAAGAWDTHPPGVLTAPGSVQLPA